jgi:hypothetical protein
MKILIKKTTTMIKNQRRRIRRRRTSAAVPLQRQQSKKKKKKNLLLLLPLLLLLRRPKRARAVEVDHRKLRKRKRRNHRVLRNQHPKRPRRRTLSPKTSRLSSDVRYVRVRLLQYERVRPRVGGPRVCRESYQYALAMMK